ncbi:hypothetical protein LAZ67_5001283 [Cordylochernes scorpioides]|uniref:Transposase n=1 Tax=Cordylochernes scorpioides TaxID=51811 RepID=A0ABY6KFF8_9ARAC|nr:hypothetical protein LAZ67_5001283 [Cordylochernes scorpioides]
MEYYLLHTSQSCIACESGDLSLVHRYWSCRYIRPLIWEAFTIIPPDLQGWVFGRGLDDDALAILASTKTRIYRYFLGVEQRNVQEDLVWRSTLSRTRNAPGPQATSIFKKIIQKKQSLCGLYNLSSRPLNRKSGHAINAERYRYQDSFLSLEEIKANKVVNINRKPVIYRLSGENARERADKVHKTTKTDVCWTCDAQISRRDIADSVGGKVRGKRSRGRRRRGYTDDLKQWTGRHEKMKRMAEEDMERPCGPSSVEEAETTDILLDKVHHILHMKLQMKKLCDRWCLSFIVLNPWDFCRRFVAVDESGKTITGEYYSTFLDRLKEELRTKCSRLARIKVLFHHENAPRHRLNVAADKLFELGFQSYPPYSPDLAPCDFFLFPNLKK